MRRGMAGAADLSVYSAFSSSRYESHLFPITCKPCQELCQEWRAMGREEGERGGST